MAENVKLTDLTTQSYASSGKVLVNNGGSVGWMSATSMVEGITESVTSEVDAKLDEVMAEVESVNATQTTYAAELYAYGVQRTVGQSSATLTRVGNTTLHATLPVQSLMVGGLLEDDGTFTPFANQTDWTGYDRSGDSGQVMVRIPSHYEYFSDDGTTQQAWVSLYPCAGFTHVPTMYVSAYEASLDRTNLLLCSVVNTDDQYKGGNNSTTYDADDFTFNGKPATGITLTNYRTYARNRGSYGLNGCGWNAYTYGAHKTLYWLYTIEYASTNCQLDYNAELDSNGYHQGGLGAGVTTINSTYWGTFNGNCPFIDCGYTDELGNGTGVVGFDMPSGYLEAAGLDSLTVSVPRYRGIENPFGHINKRMDGAIIYGTDNQLYTTDDPSLFNSTDYSSYTYKGTFSTTNGAYIKEIMWGSYGDLAAISTGGSATTYFCDRTYTSASDSIRCFAAGGSVVDGTHAGLAYLHSSHTFSDTAANYGSRLCFYPESEA